MKSDRSWLYAIVMVAAPSRDQNPISAPPRHSAEDLAQLQAFVVQIKSEQVFMEDGEYPMGNFDEEHNTERLQYDERKDSKPLYRVELSGYSLSKFKASNQQCQFYLARNGLEGREIKGRLNGRNQGDRKRVLDTPIRVDQREAERYCAWLGEVTGLPFLLPTGAQQEYTTRSRGRYVVAPADDDTTHIEGQKGINAVTAMDREIYARQNEGPLDIAPPLPWDFRPPNPLGIYDMAGDDWEWVKNWYDPGYYSHSSVRDLQDPEQSIFKDADGYYTRVLRNQGYSGPGHGLTMVRYKTDPGNKGYPSTDKTMCYVANHPSPVKRGL